jgi:predicted nucleic acid-binding protein
VVIAYLDSSAVVKRYIVENGSDIVSRVYDRALSGGLVLAMSVWNIGEVLGVLDKYLNRGWLSEEDYKLAKLQSISELLRLLRLNILRTVPVKTRIIIKAWKLIEKYHIYEADAIQLFK